MRESFRVLSSSEICNKREFISILFRLPPSQELLQLLLLLLLFRYSKSHSQRVSEVAAAAAEAEAKLLGRDAPVCCRAAAISLITWISGNLFVFEDKEEILFRDRLLLVGLCRMYPSHCNEFPC